MPETEKCVKACPKYPLTDAEIRAMDAASIAMNGEPDALSLMNGLCSWPDPPRPDKRWERKIAAACEIAVAFCKASNNRKETIRELESQLAAKDAELARVRDMLGELTAEVCRTESYGVHGSDFQVCMVCNHGTEPGKAINAMEHGPFCLIPKIEAALAAASGQEGKDGE